jgi:histidinol-phosphate phosphatase family protein
MAKTSAIWRMLLTVDYQVKPDESLRPAVFLDRDGTIIDETGYLADPGGITFYPGVPEALKRLRDRGYILVVITNQSGVGRGFFGEETALAVNLAMLRMLGEKGVDLDAIYYCPHHPEDNCLCRKPDLLMVQRALKDLVIDVSHSWVVGDIDKDVQTGIKAGLRPILVETGKLDKGDISMDVKRCETVAEAASFILEEGLK